tara:strand:+ start:231 stop:560 length:330 start_codon:yes stop_codon:yes gene_type:complete
LKKTEKLVSIDRADKHGDKVENHENIARLWSSYLQNKFKLNLIMLPEDVANLMSLLKIARTQAGSFNVDDYIDACGYLAISGEIRNKRESLKSSTLGVSNAKKSNDTNN